MLFGWPPGLSARRLRRSRATTHAALSLILLSFIFLFLFIFFTRQAQIDHVQLEPPRSRRPLDPHLQEHAKFWRALYTIILNNDPQCQHPLETVVPQKLDIMFDPSHSHARPDLLWMGADDVKRMKRAHSSFIKDLRNAPRLFYQPGTKGVVMTAGLKQLPVLTTSIRMLRRTGSTLPVQVFLATASDYDEHICGKIFPSLHANCLVFSDITQAAGTGVALEHFQFKVMALLFSSFEDALLLDSDAFPASDPTAVFDSDPFTSTGMIVWPDFWYASESPYFFDIAGLGRPADLSTRPSTESGQLIFSKSKHANSLMLAAYYNYFGPQYYYPLQSQGAPGQGDKETFHLAATTLNRTFYFVHEPVLALGHVDSNGKFFGSAMAQHDPVVDHHRLSAQSSANQHFGAPQQRPQESPVFHEPRNVSRTPLFIHANFPKFDPSTIFSYATQAPGSIGPCFDSNNTAIRSWMPQVEMERLFGFDIERAFWTEIEHVACSLEAAEFMAWEGKKDVCFSVQKYIQAVFPA